MQVSDLEGGGSSDLELPLWAGFLQRLLSKPGAESEQWACGSAAALNRLVGHALPSVSNVAILRSAAISASRSVLQKPRRAAFCTSAWNIPKDLPDLPVESERLWVWYSFAGTRTPGKAECMLLDDIPRMDTVACLGRVAPFCGMSGAFQRKLVVATPFRIPTHCSKDAFFFFVVLVLLVILLIIALLVVILLFLLLLLILVVVVVVVAVAVVAVVAVTTTIQSSSFSFSLLLRPSTETAKLRRGTNWVWGVAVASPSTRRSRHSLSSWLRYD